IPSIRDRYESPVVGPVPESQLQHTVRAAIASHTVGRDAFEVVMVHTASPDHESLRAIRVGLASGVLRFEALIKMVVTLQDEIDVLGNQKVDPGLDTLFRAVLARAGEVRLVPVGDRASIRVGVEVLSQPGCDVTEAASARPATGIRKRDEVPGPLVEGVGSVRAKGDRALVAMSATTVEILQRIGVLPVLVMVGSQDWIHLLDVRAPILIEIAVVLRHRAVF